jgi:hypothetical protein
VAEPMNWLQWFEVGSYLVTIVGLPLAIQNSDLGLLRCDTDDAVLTDDQRERRQAMFRILIALFERAYILLYDESMSPQRRRQWATWDDYMREWCQRDDFRHALPELLEGEDAAFVAHIRRIDGALPSSGRPGAASVRASGSAAP